MTAMRWEVLVSSSAVVVLLALGSLIIPGERAHVPQDQGSLSIPEDTPERSWEASASKKGDLMNLELDPTASASLESTAQRTVAEGASYSER
jgi:hypothetical protein